MSKLTFGQKLMILRKNKKITQKELADKLGIAFTSMARYENNYRLPSAEILIKLSVLLAKQDQIVLQHWL